MDIPVKDEAKFPALMALQKRMAIYGLWLSQYRPDRQMPLTPWKDDDKMSLLIIYRANDDSLVISAERRSTKSSEYGTIILDNETPKILLFKDSLFAVVGNNYRYPLYALNNVINNASDRPTCETLRQELVKSHTDAFTSDNKTWPLSQVIYCFRDKLRNRAIIFSADTNFAPSEVDVPIWPTGNSLLTQYLQCSVGPGSGTVADGERFCMMATVMSAAMFSTVAPPDCSSRFDLWLLDKDGILHERSDDYKRNIFEDTERAWTNVKESFYK